LGSGFPGPKIETWEVPGSWKITGDECAGGFSLVPKRLDFPGPLGWPCYESRLRLPLPLK
jgi:hypothetical protein